MRRHIKGIPGEAKEILAEEEEAVMKGSTKRERGTPQIACMGVKTKDLQIGEFVSR